MKCARHSCTYLLTDRGHHHIRYRVTVQFSCITLTFYLGHHYTFSQVHVIPDKAGSCNGLFHSFWIWNEKWLYKVLSSTQPDELSQVLSNQNYDPDYFGRVLTIIIRPVGCCRLRWRENRGNMYAVLRRRTPRSQLQSAVYRMCHRFLYGILKTAEQQQLFITMATVQEYQQDGSVNNKQLFEPTTL